MSVGLICQRAVETVGPNESARVAARIMQSRHVGTLVIVNQDRRPQGILSDRDLIVGVLAQGEDPAHKNVGGLMSRLPTLVHEDTSIEQALRFMRCGPYRRLIVTDRGGRLVGIVTLDDILNLIGREVTAIGRLMCAESPKRLAIDSLNHL